MALSRRQPGGGRGVKKSAPGLNDMRDLLRVLPTDGQRGFKKQQQKQKNPNYDPVRLSETDTKSTMRNAMYEQRELWRVKELTLRDTMKGLYDEYKLGTCSSKSTRCLDHLRSLRGNYGVYRIGEGWILKPLNINNNEDIYVVYEIGIESYLRNKNVPVPIVNKYASTTEDEEDEDLDQAGKFPYDAAYDGAHLVRLSYDRDSSMPTINPEKRKTLLVCDDTLLLNESRLYSSVVDVNVMSAALPSFNLVQGVPGCGKTTYILDKVEPSNIVLFATREGAREFRNRYKLRYPKYPRSGKEKKKWKRVMSVETDDSEDSDLSVSSADEDSEDLDPPVNPDDERKSRMSWKDLQRHFRTIDSYLISRSHFKPRAGKIIVDEALLVHLGSLLFAAVEAGAKEVKLVGDAHQIPYINRQRDCESLFFSPLAVTTMSEELTITFRCTNTTAAILSPYYRKGMHAVSTVRGEMSLETFTAVDKLPVDPNVKVLVFKQNEKKELKAWGYDVSTIHEYQGKQDAHIVVVRMSKGHERIYNSLPHCVVAISRHTESFTYYTPVRTDQLAKWILKSKKLTANQYIRSMQIAPTLMGEGEP